MQQMQHEYFRGDTGADRKTLVLATIIVEQASNPSIRDILAVGCGSGNDAWALGEYFGRTVIGVDLEDYFDRRYSHRVDFRTMDACALDFPDASFDLVFSFHALEHIPDYRRAVAEMRRVLRPGGIYCIGTPNRARLVGYVGVPALPFAQKLRMNLRDWRQRVVGRFRNEYGAHAGYTARELAAICTEIGPGHEVSETYYLRLYARHASMLKAFIAAGIARFIWPSTYVIGTRP